MKVCSLTSSSQSGIATVESSPVSPTSPRQGYIEKNPAFIALDICPGSIVKIPPSLINKLNSLDGMPGREEVRNALRTAVKVLMDYVHPVDGRYRPNDWLRRMDDPLQPESGNQAQKYEFIKRSPKNGRADHLYLEFDDNHQLCLLSVRDKNEQAIGDLSEEGPFVADADRLPIGGRSPRSNSPRQQELMAQLSASSSPAREESPDHSPSPGSIGGKKRAATVELSEEQPVAKRPAFNLALFPQVLSAAEIKDDADSFYDRTIEQWEAFKNKKSKRGEVLPAAEAINREELKKIFHNNAVKFEEYKKAIFEGLEKGDFDNVAPRSKNKQDAIRKFVWARLEDVETLVSHLSAEAGIDLGTEKFLDKEKIKHMKETTEKYCRVTYGQFSAGQNSVEDFFHWLGQGRLAN